MVGKMVLVFSLTEAGEQQIGWVFGKYQATMDAVGKACHICQTSMPKSTVQLPNIFRTLHAIISIVDKSRSLSIKFDSTNIGCR